MTSAAIYVSVSNSHKLDREDTTEFDQNLEVQAEPLRELVRHRGWQVHRVYDDRLSGAMERRPGLDALTEDARRNEFQVVVVFRFDRLARSTKQLVLTLERFRTLGIYFISYQETLDTSTPVGRAMFTIIAAMAELDRSTMRECAMAGLQRARQRGTKSGRAIGRPRLVFRRELVKELRERGLSWQKIARTLGISAASARRGYTG
jgi:DNA invertase Pin-like site-specific DNA recombinase